MRSAWTLIFLSRDPHDHHQLVLVSGKPDNIPPNPFNAQFGSVINQISFRVGSLDSLRKLQKILEKENHPEHLPGQPRHRLEHLLPRPRWQQP